ncbi:hypothetical protein [Cupriavidus basilensis]|uniref:hypothetical protein n=1 Tax=Cupriavidus basilensis TaxID=68895 RepID=UPI0007516A24|nr:hypothetical protein [Cupriavidus basilensis]
MADSVNLKREALALLISAAREALAVIPKIRPEDHGRGTEIRLQKALDAVVASGLDVAWEKE